MKICSKLNFIENKILHRIKFCREQKQQIIAKLNFFYTNLKFFANISNNLERSLSAMQRKKV